MRVSLSSQRAASTRSPPKNVYLHYSLSKGLRHQLTYLALPTKFENASHSSLGHSHLRLRGMIQCENVVS